MDETIHPVSSCTTAAGDKTSCKSFKVENITIVKPPLLKVFYWEKLGINRLNEKLSKECNYIEHYMEMPTRQLNSAPLKIVFWLKSLSNQTFNIHLRRVQNCPCVRVQTRVGFNQFRYLYHCPHRRLINILQEEFLLKPGDVVAMSTVTYYFLLGEHTLSYELKIDNCCTVMLHFSLNIVTFDPHKAILTRHLIPIDIREHRSLCQAIWVRNVTMQNLQFVFSTKERGFHLLNPFLTVPRQSVWPLIVEFLPNDFENELELTWTFGDQVRDCDSTSIVYRYKVMLNGKGYVDKPLEENELEAPVLDNECSDFLYVIYPNKLVFETELNDERTLIVAVHNFSQYCREFYWQNYTLTDFFSITFEPTKFTLKPHHKLLCVVQAKTFQKPLHFKRIPAVLEIHRILDKSTQIAKQLLTEIESIDDPKWAESSYHEHALLHIDLKVNFPKLIRLNIDEHLLKLPACPAIVPIMNTKSLQPNDTTTTTQTTSTPTMTKGIPTTIFEQLFWEYLSTTNHMRDNREIPRNLTYEQVINKDFPLKPMQTDAQLNRLGALNVLSVIAAEACRDLSNNHSFIPINL